MFYILLVLGGSELPLGCLFIPSFELAVNLSQHTNLVDDVLPPIALCDPDTEEIIDVTFSARKFGILPHQTYTQAFAACPQLRVIEINTVLTQTVSEKFTLIAQEISPVVEKISPGFVLMDLKGIDTYFGDVASLADKIFCLSDAWTSTFMGTRTNQNIRSLLQMHLGIADKKFTAQLAAFYGKPGVLNYIEQGAAVKFLAALPIEVLPLPSDIIERLQLLQIATIGQFTALSRSTIESQFGSVGGHAWLAGTNHDTEHLRSNIFEDKKIFDEIQLLAPISDLRVLKIFTQNLLAQLLQELKFKNSLLVRVKIGFETDTGKLYFFEKILKTPTNSLTQIWLAISHHIDRIRYSEPISILRIEFLEFINQTGYQLSLFEMSRQRQQQLIDTAQHLKTRYGYPALFQIKEVSRWHRLPEKQFALADYLT